MDFTHLEVQTFNFIVVVSIKRDGGAFSSNLATHLMLFKLFCLSGSFRGGYEHVVTETYSLFRAWSASQMQRIRLLNHSHPKQLRS